jgi:hypothetical protein
MITQESVRGPLTSVPKFGGTSRAVLGSVRQPHRISSRLRKKPLNRLLTRAAQKRVRSFAGTCRGGPRGHPVRERSRNALFPQPAREPSVDVCLRDARQILNA